MTRKLYHYPFFGAMVFMTICMLAQLGILSLHIVKERNNRSAATAYEVAWQIVEVARLVIATPENHQKYAVQNLNNTQLTTNNSYLDVTMTDKPKYKRIFSVHCDLLKLHDLLLKDTGPYHLSLKVCGTKWINFNERRIFIFPLSQMLLMAIEIVIIVGLWVWFLWKYHSFKSLQELSDATENLHTNGHNINPVSSKAPAEVQQMARALVQLQNRVKSLLKDRALLLGLASHDLRAILTRLKMRIEMLQDIDAKQKLLQNIDEMQGLLQHLVDYSRQTHIHSEAKVINVSQLLHKLIQEFAAEKQIDNSHIEDGLFTLGNPLLLEMALNNIIANAIKFGDKVWLKAHAHENEVSISVYDDGPGIAANKRDKVLNAAHQDANSDGLGLGLTLAKNVITDLQGNIDIKNNKPRGVKVIITLKASPAP